MCQNFFLWCPLAIIVEAFSLYYNRLVKNYINCLKCWHNETLFKITPLATVFKITLVQNYPTDTFSWRALLAEFIFSKVWSLQNCTEHWLVMVGLWKQFFHIIIVVCRLIYKTAKSIICANLIPFMIYGLLKRVQQFCHPVFGHKVNFMLHLQFSVLID